MHSPVMEVRKDDLVKKIENEPGNLYRRRSKKESHGEE
jgi:hypothetical protein